MDSYKRNQIIGGVTLAVALSLITWHGFDTEMATITQCESTVVRYVTAEYSETTTSVDSKGNVSTDTDYWSEAASPRYMVVTINGELNSVSHDFQTNEVVSGYYAPPMPKHDKSMSRDFDFDNFQKHTDHELIVTVYREEGIGHDTFSEGIESTNECVDKLQGEVSIKTWYGSSYSANWR